MKRLLLFLVPVLLLVVAATASGVTGTAQVVAHIATGAQPCSEAGGFDAVWVGNYGEGTLARIDPATNTVTGKVRVGTGVCGIAVGAGSVWVDGFTSGSVIRVNPTRMKIVKRCRTRSGT